MNEISRLRAGLQAVVDCKDSVARSAIREHCASILSQSPEDARSGVQSERDKAANYWADWLIDAVGGATQNRALLRGDPDGDEVLTQAIVLNGRKAILNALAALALPSAHSRSEAEQSTRQYYYRENKCTAANAEMPDCICWHDEGTGPYADDASDAQSWRVKPSTVTSTQRGGE